jgi:YHS domain-containing protein
MRIPFSVERINLFTLFIKENSMRLSSICFFALVLLLGSTRAEDKKPDGDTKPSPAPAPNKMCPVMQGETASEKYFVEYNGQKVYLCCKKCVRKFQADPEKYMKRLADMNKDASTKSSDNNASGTDTKKSDDKSAVKSRGGNEKEEEDDDDDDDKGGDRKAGNRQKKHDD